VYSITLAGRAALRAWLTDSTLELTAPRDPFLLKLFFARRAGPAAAVEYRLDYAPVTAGGFVATQVEVSARSDGQDWVTAALGAFSLRPS
jgi:hypothetical protein